LLVAAQAIVLADVAGAQAPPAANQPAGPGQPGPAGEVFGREVALPSRTIVYFKGIGNWDAAFETILDAFRAVAEYLARAGIAPAGLQMVVYTAVDDASFHFQAGVPVAAAPRTPPAGGDIAVGQSPQGRAVMFVHRGSYDAMETTYDAITNYLDEKRLDPQEMYVEEYVTDPLKTPEDELVINVYVPIK
jgi:effector-binding domain-containing protein